MDILLMYIMKFVGIPYRWGGDDTIDGFDCSGGIQEILASVGLDPAGDQTAQSLYDHFSKDGTIGAHGLGSLVFFGKSLREITHIGIMVDTYRFFEFGGGGSKTTSKEAAAAQNAYGRIRHIKNRKDLVAVIKPRYVTIGQF